MSKINIIRAWKDESYLAQLSEEDRNSLPGNPAGAIEISDEGLNTIVGNGFTLPPRTAGRFCHTGGVFCPPSPTNPAPITKGIRCLA